MAPVTLQAKKVKVQAVKWDGSRASLLEIEDFVPSNKLGKEHVQDEGINLVVYNDLEFQWISVPLGHWIIRGLKDEYYPCEEDALFKKYSIVDENLDPITVEELLEWLRAVSSALRLDEYIKAKDIADLGWSLNGLVNRIMVNGIKDEPEA